MILKSSPRCSSVNVFESEKIEKSLSMSTYRPPLWDVLVRGGLTRLLRVAKPCVSMSTSDEGLCESLGSHQGSWFACEIGVKRQEAWSENASKWKDTTSLFKRHFSPQFKDEAWVLGVTPLKLSLGAYGHCIKWLMHYAGGWHWGNYHTPLWQTAPRPPLDLQNRRLSLRLWSICSSPPVFYFRHIPSVDWPSECGLSW